MAQPTMKSAWALYNLGDKVAARREACEVLNSKPSPEDEKEARDLTERTRTPAFALRLAAVLVVFIVGMVILARIRYG